MGFLDHSTNNIIIDAVLTNLGREILASNAGAFQISKFSLADDEVDYSIIRKFGRTIGKEKIIKNTPVFEAQTAQDIALRYQLISIADPSTTHLPIFIAERNLAGGASSGQLTNAKSAGGSVTEFFVGNNGLKASIIKVKQSPGGGSGVVPAGLFDQQFDIFVNSRFLTVAVNGGAAVSYNSLDPLTMMARYTRPQTGGSGAAGGEIEFQVQSKNISNEDFLFYGDTTSGNTIIKTMVSIVGRNSGTRIDIVAGVQQTT